MVVLNIYTVLEIKLKLMKLMIIDKMKEILIKKKNFSKKKEEKDLINNNSLFVCCVIRYKRIYIYIYI